MPEFENADDDRLFQILQLLLESSAPGQIIHVEDRDHFIRRFYAVRKLDPDLLKLACRTSPDNAQNEVWIIKQGAKVNAIEPKTNP